jgi:hypothetical protein
MISERAFAATPLREFRIQKFTVAEWMMATVDGDRELSATHVAEPKVS